MPIIKRLKNYSFSAKPGTLLLFVLAAIILFQGAQLSRNARADLIRIYRNTGQPALLRGARFSHGANFAQFVGFLLEAVPEYARVVLPPPGFGPKYIRHTPNMQFFLAPRLVINCTALNCLENLDRENTYILTVQGFPGSDYPSLASQTIMFDESWGFIPPEDGGNPSGDALRGYNSLFEILLAALPPLLWLSALAVSGALIIQFLLPGFGVILKAGLGYGLGLSIFSFALGALALFGVPVNRVSALSVTSVLLVFSAFTGLLSARRGDTAAGPGSPEQRGRLKIDFWLIPILLLGFTSILIGVGKGYHATDEIVLWGAKGYGIAAMQSPRNIIQWGTNTVVYPLHVPILIASAKLLFGEALPASKMIFSGYYLALLLVIYQGFLDEGLRKTMAALSVLLIGTLPVVFRHATIAYANLPLSFYYVSAIILLIRSLEGSRPRRAENSALLSGIFLACSAWTRPEGLAMAWLGTGFVLAFQYFWSRKRISIRFLVYLLAPLVLYSIYWVVFKSIIYPVILDRADLVSEALTQISRGNLHLDEALFVIASTFKRPFVYQVWGALGLILMFLALTLLLFRNMNQTGFLYLLTGIFVTGMTAGIYYLASFDRVHDISWWISTGYDRMLLPGTILLIIGGITLAGKFFDDRQRGPISFDPE